MKKTLTVLLVLVLLFSLCACGEDDPNAGLYTCTKIETSGMTMGVEDVFPKGVTLELKNGGRGILDVEGDSGTIRWAMDGDKFIMETSDGTSEGTLIDGVITIELIDSGVTLTLVGENAKAPALLQELPSAAPAEETPEAPVETPEAPVETPEAPVETAEVPVETPEAPADTPEPAEVVTSEWWNGDWYGWWQSENSKGQFPESWYDAFAEVEVMSDGSVYMALWDEDYERSDPMAEVAFRFEESTTDKGRLVSTTGYFYSMEIKEGDWIIDPDDLIVDEAFMIEGHYQDSDGEDFDFVFVLRPWGTDWSDLDEEDLPYFYYNWYLPLIQAGEPMPDFIPEDIIEAAYGS